MLTGRVHAENAVLGTREPILIQRLKEALRIRATRLKYPLILHHKDPCHSNDEVQGKRREHDRPKLDDRHQDVRDDQHRDQGQSQWLEREEVATESVLDILVVDPWVSVRVAPDTRDQSAYGGDVGSVGGLVIRLLPGSVGEWFSEHALQTTPPASEHGPVVSLAVAEHASRWHAIPLPNQPPLQALATTPNEVGEEEDPAHADKDWPQCLYPRVTPQQQNRDDDREARQETGVDPGPE